MQQIAIQDQLHGNHCFGCGLENDQGLKIKSYWDGEQTVCRFQPLAHHASIPSHILNGGIIATVIDCHTVCTAIADAYRRADRDVGSEPSLWYVTGSLQVRYLRPASIHRPIELAAQVVEYSQRKSVVRCSVHSGQDHCADGDVVAVKIDAQWLVET